MPVQEATTSAMSSAPTSSLTMVFLDAAASTSASEASSNALSSVGISP